MKKFTIILTIVMVLALSLAGTALAISNGRPDGDNHPYVGMAIGPATGGGYWVCSAAAISPKVVVTASHCFEGPNVLVNFAENPLVISFSEWTPGLWTPNPDWCIGCSGGILGFDTHDVAVIVLDTPVILSRYAQLPAENLVDTLPMNTNVDLVGYGVQFYKGCGAECPEEGAFTRYYAPSKLIASDFVWSDEYIRLTANPAMGKGGTCFGDSGGPDLLGGTDIILAVNSYVTNGNCAGVTYSNRIDTYALNFIESFLP